jgi:hypothetical protein
MASSIVKSGFRFIIWIIVIIVSIQSFNNMSQISELEKQNYVTVPNFTFNGNIPRFQYTANPNSPDLCTNIDVGHVSRFFNGQNFDESFRDWRNVLTTLVPEGDDAAVTRNLKESLCILSRTSGLQQVNVTTQQVQNTTAQFFYNQFNDPISKWVYGLSITIGMLFFLYFLYKIVYKVGVFKYANPLSVILYILVWIILFSVLIGFAFKEDEIVKSTGGTTNVNEQSSIYYRLLTGYIITFFIFIIIANVCLFNEKTGSWIYKLSYDMSILFLMIFCFFVLIIMPYLFVFASTLFYLLSQSFENLGKTTKNFLTSKFSFEFNENEIKKNCNATGLMPQVYKASWTLPFFQILLGFIDDFVEVELTAAEKAQKERISKITNNHERKRLSGAVNNSVQQRLRKALKARDLTESSIDNDNIF